MSTKKSILIVSAGPGLSLSVAEQFGNEGFSVGLMQFALSVVPLHC